MDQDLETLRLLAEVTVAFVAFSAIVASLRINLGHKLLPFQRLLIHFFTESGMLNMTASITPLILASFYDDERTISTITIMYILAIILVYLSFYFVRRVKIKAPTPLPSVLTMIGYAIWVPVLVMVALGELWEPTLGLVQVFCFWALVSSAIIFAYFLSTFVDSDDYEIGDEPN